VLLDMAIVVLKCRPVLIEPSLTRGGAQQFGQPLLQDLRKVDIERPGLLQQIAVDAQVGGPFGGVGIEDGGCSAMRGSFLCIRCA